MTRNHGVPSAKDAQPRTLRLSRNRDYTQFPDTLGKTPIVIKGKVAYATTLFVEQGARAAVDFLQCLTVAPTQYAVRCSRSISIGW
jgi:hypothetical protein